MKISLRIITIVIATLLWASVALAAKKIMLSPFVVNGPQSYSYLGQAVPSTLSSRLVWPGHVEADPRMPAKPIPNANIAAQAQRSSNVDYIVWGTVSIVNNTATIDVFLRNKAGKIFKRNVQGPVGNLIGSVQNIASGLSSEAFGRNAAPRQAQGYNPPAGQQYGSNAPSGAIIPPQNTYLNPQFRYQGSGTEDGSRLRSKSLGYSMVDFVVGDFSGSGRSEVAILGDHKLTVYDWSGGSLKVKSEVSIGMANQAFILRKVKLGGRGTQLLVTSFGGSRSRPTSFIYSFARGKLSLLAKTNSYFLNVVPLAPSFRPTLVGQAWDSARLFRGGVYVANVNGSTISLGTKLSLPKGGNVFNFAYMGGSDGTKLLMYSPEERLVVYNTGGRRLHQTMDRFSGSAVGIEHYKSIPGMGVDKRYQIAGHFYAPMRINVADIEGRGEYVALVNKPISTAAEIFDNYRMFPQGEIHALYWDGVGLGLKWKTRRIRGSVVNCDVGDINNDGVLDLIVGMNTHPGAIGVGNRRGLLMVYPMDTNQTNPNTPMDNSDYHNTGRY